MAAFQPHGSRALRVIITELAAQAQIGGLLTFSQLTEAIGVRDDDAGRSRVRVSVSAARPLLLRDHRRALVARRGIGYRVAMPGEFAGIAQDHRRKSDKAINRALAVINNAPVEDMSPEEARRFQAVGMVITRLHARVTDTEQRLSDLEQLVYGPPRSSQPSPVEQSAVERGIVERSGVKRS